jgi:hypothetical protein
MLVASRLMLILEITREKMENHRMWLDHKSEEVKSCSPCSSVSYFVPFTPRSFSKSLAEFPDVSASALSIKNAVARTNVCAE